METGDWKLEGQLSWHMLCEQQSPCFRQGERLRLSFDLRVYTVVCVHRRENAP